MPRKKTLLQQVSSRQTLFSAWKTVYASASQSQSQEIKGEAENYSAELFENLGRLQWKLARSAFEFSPIKGIIQKKKNNKKRPIGIAKIDDRIVQRAILDTLLKIKPLYLAVNNKNSFGGNTEGGVQKAISALLSEVKSGATFFAKTDIKNFFGTIPHDRAISVLFKFLPDDSINDLLKSAISCELSNAKSPKINEFIELFPKDQIGIIQGCCLSPLLGNLLLHEFDMVMNLKNVTCLRYIDDYIIVGGERQVLMSFHESVRILSELGLDVYKLTEEKAGCGLLKQGLDFLGCFIQPGAIRPSSKSRGKLLGGIRLRLQESILEMKAKDKYDPKKHSFCATLNYVRVKLKGWRDAYGFCNDKQFFESVENSVLRSTNDYIETSLKLIHLEGLNSKKAHLMGIGVMRVRL